MLTLFKKYTLIFFILFMPLPVLLVVVFAFNDVLIPLIFLVFFYIYTQYYLIKIFILDAAGNTIPFKVIATIFITSSLFVSMIFLALDNIPRFISWYTLDKEKITSSAKDYSRNAPVCLYVVECSSGLPKLQLFSKIDDLNMTELKQLVWKRRFSGYCEGPTENIVLDFPDNIDRSSARWSFAGDGFITNNGHWQGSSVSFYPWEKCTKEKATWNKQD